MKQKTHRIHQLTFPSYKESNSFEEDSPKLVCLS